MDESSFWQMIDRTRVASGDDSDQHIELLVDELAKLSEADIIGFDTIFHFHMGRAYNRNLWAACQVFDSCADDSFSDFCGWLIAQGKDVYERALADPDSLVDVVDLDTDATPESFSYVSMTAYEKRTGGKEMPLTPHLGRRVGLTGDDWEEAKKKVPRLRDKFK